jgi:uncharacterized membrane protein YqjE
LLQPATVNMSVTSFKGNLIGKTFKSVAGGMGMVELRPRDYTQQGDGRSQGQAPNRLNRAVDEVQAGIGLIIYEVRERLGMNDGPQPTLAEDLRRGQQEMVGIGRDLADISKDIRVLAQQEMQRARAEMRQQLQFSSRALALGAIAGVFGFFTLAFLSLTVMFALDLVLPRWAAALATTGLLAVLAISAGFIAYQQFRRIRLMPQRTLKSVKEDIEWARNQWNSNGK